MGALDPELAVREKLRGPVGAPEPVGEDTGGWRSGVVPGGNTERADLDTVRFLKHRMSANRHLYFVTFDGTHPAFGPKVLSFRYVYEVEPDLDGGRCVRGSAGGGGESPRRSRPWVNLGGGGWPDRFFAGGSIDRAGVEIERIELRFANGVPLHDDCNQDCALFITDHPVDMPGTVAMLGRAGNEIATHPAFPGT